ncbi:MAG: cyclic nucleotide-binding domain-containing protein [Ardenticatenaceae bacterium]|nr:cyclic nucleotide-binding domain-containing protein [Ardenticatenaceae bacterium]
MSTEEFWQALDDATNPTAYKPLRNPHIIVSRLQNRTETYYVIKEPQSRSYLRLGEEDYALWWQMDGRKSVKELLFYCLKRYKKLPIGHLTTLIGELKDGNFLEASNTKVYDQIEAELAARAPASRGQKLLKSFLYTELAISGLDDVFIPLYKQLKPLFWPIGQILLFLLVLIGGFFFGLSYFFGNYNITGSGLGVLTLLVANLIVIGLHEMAHGLMTKHVGRELDRGGFLLYWGFPAFFVDTRDTWLSPRLDRIKVSWAGPYSGLMLGGLIGVVLTAVSAYSSPEFQQTLLATFLFQIGFLAYLSVVVNLNPLLELDGYFMLMDWLEMPGLRDRAFDFLRHELWPRLREAGSPIKFWHSLNRAERIFTLFGVMALVYSVFALWLAITFWQGYVSEFFLNLWHSNAWWGRLVVGLITAVLILPALYYLGLYGWSRIRAGLEWLARRQLLSRTDVLALLVGVPILLGSPLLYFFLNRLNAVQTSLWQGIFVWLLHIGTGAALVGVARQLPGSRFQWALWALTAVPLALALAWISPNTFGRDLALMATAGAILAAGIVSWFTINPGFLAGSDRLLMALFILLGIGTYTGMSYFLGSDLLAENGRWLATAVICLGTGLGLALMAPLLLNFARSRFAIPWGLFALAILITPWLQIYPQLDFTVITLWLYATVLYLLLGTLAQFMRSEITESETSIFSERQRLINSYNQFIHALFTSYETIFGQRRLTLIQKQMAALGALDPDSTILELGQHAQKALLLAVDRLDDLAGTPFTRKAGQAAYDSLDWLDAETLARHVLSKTEWGAQLAQGFIRARDKRIDLIRQADLFAGFDQEGVEELLHVMRRWRARPHQLIAHGGQDALYFYLIEAGEVGVYHNGEQRAVMAAGGYFGTAALAGTGVYQFTYRALTPLTTLVVDRDQFDPLLRADTTLAQQVSSGAEERSLLRQMPLFSGLSPQELASVDARLQPRQVTAGEQFVQQGQPRNYLYIVAEGEVEVFVTEDGVERVIGKLGPGEHFGEYALFADTPYHASVRAKVDSRLLLLDEPKFDELVATCDRMTHYVEQIGSGRLIATRRRATPTALIS